MSDRSTRRKKSMNELERLMPSEFRKKVKKPVVLVLDNLRSGLNVGSLFRTADAFAIEAVYLCGITVQPPHRELLKTAIGAELSVSWKYFDTAKAAVEELNQKGYWVVGVEQTTDSISINEWQPGTEQIALVLGNEVEGLDETVLPLLDQCLEIPQYGTKHSLNVAVCGGIVLWDALKKLRN